MNNVWWNSCVAAVFVALTLADGGNVEAAEAEVGFAIRQFIVEGNTLLGEADIQAAVKNFTGDNRHFADVQAALEALQVAYQEAGYGSAVVTIPEQELADGVVHLKVIEPRLKSVTLTYDPPEGQEAFDPANVRDSLPDLQEGGLVNTQGLSSDLLLANENPARQMEVVLRNDESPGELDANVKVKAQPARKAYLTLDNTGTEQSGEYRIGVGLQHANLFGLDHVATFNYITAIDRPTDINLFSGSYRLPLYPMGDSIDMFASKSDVGAITTATVAGPLQFAGNGEIYGIRYNFLLPRFGEYTHRLIAGLDYRQFKNACTLGDFGEAGCGPAAADITLVPASLTYSGQLNQQNLGLNFYFNGVHNIPGMENGTESSFHTVRPSNDGSGNGAPADYYALRGGFSLTVGVGYDWLARLAGNAQYSSDPLVYVEQFSLAGNSMVRGFWEREVTRDMGYVLNSEIYTPNFAKSVGVGDYLRGLAFFDYGSGRNNPLVGETAQEIALTSVGVGLRLGFTNSFQLKFDGAYVLDGAGDHKDGDARGHLSVYLPYAF